MTSQRQLDRLMQLRRQRTRLAEEALAAEQRNCREFEAHCQTLGQALEHHQYQAVQREQALFEQGEQRPLTPRIWPVGSKHLPTMPPTRRHCLSSRQAASRPSGPLSESANTALRNGRTGYAPACAGATPDLSGAGAGGQGRASGRTGDGREPDRPGR